MGTQTRTAGATKTLIDVATGEYWAIEESAKGKGRYVFPGGFAFVGLVYISKLRQVKLPADGYRLALLVMEKAGYGGVCSLPHVEMSEQLGVHRSRVSRLIGSLERASVIQRIGSHKSGCLLVNPTFCFRGTPKEQHKALEMWSASRPFGVVKPMRKTA